MYFFIKILENEFDAKPTVMSSAFIAHYKEQLTGKYVAMIDIMIEEVYNDEFELNWYLDKLQKLETYFISMGESIDFNVLNKAPEVYLTFTKPIPVVRILNFINNVRWVLRVKDTKPVKEGFVVFHKVLDNNGEWVDI